MQITLRAVSEKDLKKIYDWRNQPSIREASLTTHEISWEEHQKYWNSRFQNAEAYSLIIVLDRTDVGLVRLDHLKNSYEVHILLSYGHQGKGIGSKALEEAKEFAKSKGIAKLCAKIKPDNIASQKIFEKNGFSKAGSGYECKL